MHLVHCQQHESIGFLNVSFIVYPQIVKFCSIFQNQFLHVSVQASRSHTRCKSQDSLHIQCTKSILYVFQSFRIDE